MRITSLIYTSACMYFSSILCKLVFPRPISSSKRPSLSRRLGKSVMFEILLDLNTNTTPAVPLYTYFRFILEYFNSKKDIFSGVFIQGKIDKIYTHTTSVGVLQIPSCLSVGHIIPNITNRYSSCHMFTYARYQYFDNVGG